MFLYAESPEQEWNTLSHLTEAFWPCFPKLHSHICRPFWGDGEGGRVKKLLERGGRAKGRGGHMGRWVGLIETDFFFFSSILFV